MHNKLSQNLPLNYEVYDNRSVVNAVVDTLISCLINLTVCVTAVNIYCHYHCVFNPLECTDNYSATSNYMKLVHWLLMGGLLHLVQRGGDWAWAAARPVPSSLYQM